MISFLRERLQGIVAFSFLGVVALTFAFLGLPTFTQTFSVNEYAKVGNYSISQSEYFRAKTQVEENLHELITGLEEKNINSEIETFAEFLLLASSLFEMKAKRLLPQEEDIDWIDEVQIMKDKDLAFARLLQFKDF